MKNENTERIREKVLVLIESQFESDAAFERALSLPEKTVNNWRRGRSASFMKMLPKLSAGERAQFKAQAKNAAASEIRSKKRHSMNAATATPAVVILPPPPQTENPSPAKVKGKETAVL